MGMADPTEMRAVSPWPGGSYIYRKETQTAVNTEPGIRGGEEEVATVATESPSDDGEGPGLRDTSYSPGGRHGGLRRRRGRCAYVVMSIVRRNDIQSVVEHRALMDLGIGLRTLPTSAPPSPGRRRLLLIRRYRRLLSPLASWPWKLASLGKSGSL